MEFFLKAITTYVIARICKVLESFFRHLWTIEKEIEQCEIAASSEEEAGHCPLRPIVPRPDYLEAMLGDLLEWQNELQAEGLPAYRIIWLTLVQFMDLMIDVVEMTLHNLIVPDPSRKQAKPSGDLATDADADVVEDDSSPI